MKYFNLILLFLLLFISCSNDEAGGSPIDDVTLTCLPEKVEAPAIRGEYILKVTCSAGEWTAYASDDCSSWIAVKVAGSLDRQGTVTVTVDANTGQVLRSGSVVIKSGLKRITIPVTQEAPMSVSKREIYSNSGGETVTLSVIATGEWSVKSNDSWIKAVKSDNKTVTVTTEPNEKKASRNGTLEIVLGVEKITVSVIQESRSEERRVGKECM